MDVFSIEDLYLLTPTGDMQITLKLAQAGMAMKSSSDSKVTTIKKEEMREIELFRGTRRFNLRINTTASLFNINNIPEEHIEKIKDLSNRWYNKVVYIKELEIANVSSGKMLVTDDFLEFSNQKLIFDIPLSEIQSVHEIKNEISISFKESKDNITEIRFLTNQKNLISNIKERIENEKFKEIVTFETLQTVLPRGKCDYIFYDNHFKIVGSTYEHKVFYSSVKGIFYLEKYDFDQNDNKEYFLALNVDPPIRQGQTRYSFIVINFYEVEEEEFTLNLTEEDKIKHNELQEEYTGPVGSSFLKIMKILTNSKVFSTKDFVTKEGNRSLKCASKAYEGYLYPLSKSLLFLPKAIYMPHSDISLVEFSRVNLSVLTAKTFDMKIFTSEGQFTFNSIQKEDFGPIERYFSEHNINVRSEVIDDQDEYSEEEDEEETTDIMNTSDSEED